MMSPETCKSVWVDSESCSGGKQGDVILKDVGPIDSLNLTEIPQDCMASISHGHHAALNLQDVDDAHQLYTKSC